MKKIITGILLVTTSLGALADGRYGHDGRHYDGYQGGYYGPRIIHQNQNYYHGSNAGDILFPMVIGGIVGWSINEASKQPQVIVQQPQVIYQQPRIIPSTEDVYQYQTIYDATCSCYKRILVKID